MITALVKRTTKIDVAIRCVHRKNNCDHVLMLQQTITYHSDLFSKGQVSLCMLKYHLVTVYLICLLCTSERTARHTVFKFNLGLHSLSQIFVSLSNCMLLDYLYHKLVI